MASAVTVTVPSRLHFGLLDMSRRTSRSFGGAGLAIASPTTVVTITTSQNGLVVHRMSDATRKAVTDSVGLLCANHSVSPNISIDLLESPSEHVGLGSRTSIVMAVLIGVRELLEMSIEDKELQICSLRGRTSGVGVNTAITGGFVVDAGQPGHVSVVPSSFSKLPRPSTLVTRAAFPQDWKILIINPDGNLVSGETELKLFTGRPDVSEFEIRTQISTIYHEILPAIMEKDIKSFGLAMNRFASLGFKKYEVLAQPVIVRRLVEELRETACCAGMSSVGPTVYAIFRPDIDRDQVNDNIIRLIGPNRHYWTSARNEGYVIDE